MTRRFLKFQKELQPMIRNNKQLVRIYRNYVRIIGSFYSWFFNSLFFRPLVWAFKIVGTRGFGSNVCLKSGYLPLPVHFYSPIPNIDDLEKRKVWSKKSPLLGIDFNIKNQLILLKKLGKNWGQECNWPLNSTNNPADFFIDNGCFGYGCAAILHSMIREFRPKNIIEIGSGNSSKIISRALEANKIKTYYTMIDPYPVSYISLKKIKYHRLIKKRLELVNLSLFKRLVENDILFIDSSHVVKTGGDVNALYLDLLPKLNPGVIVHIHDIGLPFEYPKTYAVNETCRYFWTEQYLLQAFLTFNSRFEILLANAYLMINHKKEFRQVFSTYNPKIHQAISGGFWIKKVK